MDPAEHVMTPGRTRRVVLRDVVDARNRHVWDVVVDQFVSMGVSRTGARIDAWRLRNDTMFHHAWASSLPVWCPDLAWYVRASE